MELVRCSVADTVPAQELFVGLTAADWEAIYTLARRQTVCGICYAAYCRLPGALLPGAPLLPRWVARVNAIETANSRMGAAVGSLVASFRSARLHPVVQKGLSVARYYPAPELRESGDIDLWFGPREMGAALDIVRRSGAAVKAHPDGSRSFVSHGFTIELHPRLINLSAPRARRRLEALVWSHTADTGRGDLPSPSPLLELLLIDVHIMRHAFGTGIGLRQICDYMLASAALAGRYSRNEFARACADLGIARWTALLNAFAVSYLGADAGVLPPSGYAGRRSLPVGALMKIIAEGGNFGLHRHAGSARRAGGKLHTVAMLLRRSRMALSIAPAEAFWNIVRLTGGQLK